MINIHTHIFTLNHVPLGFVPLQRLLTRRGRFRKLWVLLLYLLSGMPRLTMHRGRESRKAARMRPDALLRGCGNGRNSHKKSARMALFLLRGSRPTQAEIFSQLQAFYPTGTRFAVHTIDFDYMGAGGFATDPSSGRPYNYLHQLEEVAQLKASKPLGDALLPFFCADPRRPDVTALAQEYLLKRGFSGIKLYPAMGFFPTDSRLIPLWEWVAQTGIPVMVHCSRNGAVYGRTRPEAEISSSPGLSHLLTGQPYTPASLRGWAERYSHPLLFEPLLREYKGLKICFAHFGGEEDCMELYREGGHPHDNWCSHICRLMKSYPGVYADISFSSAHPDLMAFFHVLAQHRAAPSATAAETDARYSMADKILFGSDYYMSSMKRNERWFSINQRALMGEESFRRIASDNPERFLKWHGKTIS